MKQSYSKPRDLPCAGRPIRLLLMVKKFFCRQTNSHTTFTERLADLIEVSCRLTKHLRSAVQDVGFATCGKINTSLAAYFIKIRRLLGN